MTINELEKVISNLEKGLSTTLDGEYVKLRKNVLQGISENYRELLKYKELGTVEELEECQFDLLG